MNLKKINRTLLHFIHIELLNITHHSQYLGYLLYTLINKNILVFVIILTLLYSYHSPRINSEYQLKPNGKLLTIC